MSPQWVWSHWQKGGQVDGIDYVGEQLLVNAIRSKGINNLIWVEGPYWAKQLTRVREHPVNGSNIVYSIHHPKLDNPASWDKVFGDLSSEYPVVDGEWAQYAAPNRPECYPNAYSNVPRFLRYLRAHDIGLVAWFSSLVKTPHNTALSDTSNARTATNPQELQTPNIIRPDYACDNQHIGQGAGALIQQYFARYSR